MAFKFAIDDVWIEALRPKTLDDVIGNELVIRILKKHIETGNLQHYLFSGPPGVGKTSVAICMAKTIWGDSYRQHFMELNASDTRGIDTVRETIKEAAMQSNSKIIFLSECDAMTPPAQDTMRRVIEKYSSTTRFILDCNYISKIIDPIISRMTPFHFAPLTRDNVNTLIDKICLVKNLKVSPEIRDILYRYSRGDSRKVINTLQSASILSPEISKEVVQVITQVPDIETAKIILTQAVTGDFISAREVLLNQYVQKGLDHELICDAIIDAAAEMKFSEDKNHNQRIASYITAFVSDHAHFMDRSSARIEFSGILAKIANINNSITMKGIQV